MKALSIRQPWAHAILHLGKRVENRDWAGCSYRGPVLLHAAKSLVLRDFNEDVESILDIVKPATNGEKWAALDQFAYRRAPVAGKHRGEYSWRPAPSLPFGGIVGRARIVDIIDLSPAGPARTSRAHGAQLSSPWYAGGFALVLADVEPLPFIPYKGALGFFDVPDHLVAAALDGARPA